MDGDASARLRVALEMHVLGEQMLRRRLQRDQPDITDAQLDDAIRAWLHDRPGAKHGDAVGPPSERFE